MVLAAGSPPVALKAQIGGFMKRFPGIQVNHIPSTGSDASAKIQLETRVGMATYEVAQATTTSAERLLKADLLAPFPYHEFGIAKNEISFGERLVPWFDLTRVLGFNTKLVSRDQVPTTWEGLLDPKWKGRKIIVVGPGVSLRRPGAGVGVGEDDGVHPEVRGPGSPSFSPGAAPRPWNPWWRGRRRWR